MPRKYGIAGTQNVDPSIDSALGLTSTAAIRPEIFFISFGSHDTPADNSIRWTVQRYTVAGTSTAVTPAAVDSGDPAATATAGENFTVEPTYTAGAILLDVAVNQRATWQFTARQGCEFKLPATAANGIGIQPRHSSFSGLVIACLSFME